MLYQVPPQITPWIRCIRAGPGQQSTRDQRLNAVTGSPGAFLKVFAAIISNPNYPRPVLLTGRFFEDLTAGVIGATGWQGEAAYEFRSQRPCGPCCTGWPATSAGLQRAVPDGGHVGQRDAGRVEGPGLQGLGQSAAGAEAQVPGTKRTPMFRLCFPTRVTPLARWSGRSPRRTVWWTTCWVSTISCPEQGAPAAGYACCFTGRRSELAELAGWMTRPPLDALRVVTGRPGAGKSVLLGVFVCLAHPEFAEHSMLVRSRIGAAAAPPPCRHHRGGECPQQVGRAIGGIDRPVMGVPEGASQCRRPWVELAPGCCGSGHQCRRRVPQEDRLRALTSLGFAC